MTILSKIFREPLLHFVVIGAAVFGLYALVTGSDRENARDTIVVTEGRIQQLAQVFAKTWQRPPTPEELRGLVDAYIKEEVYYREALKLGLDRDDTLIRRRMQQKMEFVTEPDEVSLVADDPTLQAFLDANRATFRVEPRIAFEQVFLNPDKAGDAAPARAEQALAALKASAPGEIPPEIGDPTLLPAEMPLAPLSGIARNFGEAFAAHLTDLEEDVWAGPIKSPYGLHLVRVMKRIDGYDPELAEIRDAVLQTWRTEKRDEFQDQAYDQLLAKYEIVLPANEGGAPSAEPAP
ncbi:MAG: peptidylprolyl isomerase [Hyphomicrobiales bacterium]